MKAEEQASEYSFLLNAQDKGKFINLAWVPLLASSLGTLSIALTLLYSCSTDFGKDCVPYLSDLPKISPYIFQVIPTQSLIFPSVTFGIASIVAFHSVLSKRLDDLLTSLPGIVLNLTLVTGIFSQVWLFLFALVPSESFVLPIWFIRMEEMTALTIFILSSITYQGLVLVLSYGTKLLMPSDFRVTLRALIFCVSIFLLSIHCGYITNFKGESQHEISYIVYRVGIYTLFLLTESFIGSFYEDLKEIGFKVKLRTESREIKGMISATF
jgi:hypothetical protein